MNLFEKRTPVLMYHRIDRSDHSSLAVSPEGFARQMDWLERKKFSFLSLDEVVNRQGRVPVLKRSVAITFDDGFEDNYENALSVLIRRRKSAALFVVVNLVGQKGFLSWNQIHEISQAGILIGSHSLSHRWLPDLTDNEELRREVVDSKKRIEDRLGKEVRHFSYPVGGVNERVVDQVRGAGYKAGWVAGARPSVSTREPLFSIRRVKISPSDSSLSRFAVKAYGIKGLFG